MAEVAVIICDECGVQKKQSNHWYAAFKQLQELTVVPIDALGDHDIKPIKHLCGQSCAHALLDRFMTTGSLEK